MKGWEGPEAQGKGASGLVSLPLWFRRRSWCCALDSGPATQRAAQRTACSPRGAAPFSECHNAAPLHGPGPEWQRPGMVAHCAAGQHHRIAGRLLERKVVWRRNSLSAPLAHLRVATHPARGAPAASVSGGAGGVPKQRSAPELLHGASEGAGGSDGQAPATRAFSSQEQDGRIVRSGAGKVSPAAPRDAKEDQCGAVLSLAGASTLQGLLKALRSEASLQQHSRVSNAQPGPPAPLSSSSSRTFSRTSSTASTKRRAPTVADLYFEQELRKYTVEPHPADEPAATSLAEDVLHEGEEGLLPFAARDFGPRPLSSLSTASTITPQKGSRRECMASRKDSMAATRPSSAVTRCSSIITTAETLDMQACPIGRDGTMGLQHSHSMYSVGAQTMASADDFHRTMSLVSAGRSTSPRALTQSSRMRRKFSYSCVQGADSEVLQMFGCDPTHAHASRNRRASLIRGDKGLLYTDAAHLVGPLEVGGPVE